jgi:tetratricopeptide (TPR) repeat protein
MEKSDQRLRALENRVEEIGEDLRVLRDLLDRDNQSALNKIRYVTEKVLHRLCSERGVSWGSAEPTVERMIGPLVAAKALPKGVALHVRTIQTHASPGSHYQEEPLSATHVHLAQLALVEFLEWYYRAEVTAPVAETTDEPPVSTARSPVETPVAPSVPRPQSGRSPWVGAALALGAVALVVIVWRAVGPASVAPPAAGASTASPSSLATETAATATAAPLVEPKQGLRALELYRAPRGRSAAALASSEMWRSVATDFDEAMRQRGAPVRWHAAQAFAVGEMHLCNGAADEAVAAFQEAVALDEGWSFARVGLAAALLLQGNDSEALDAAQKAERLEPDWWGAIAMVGRVLAASDRSDESVRTYLRALELAPKEPALLSEIALVYHGARLDAEADRYAKQAIEADEDVVAARILLAERALERSDAKAALEQAGRAVAVAPQSVAGRLAYADAQALLGKRDEALDGYRRALDDWTKTGKRYGPPARMAVVERALADGKLPPPRVAKAGQGERTAKPQPKNDMMDL